MSTIQSEVGNAGRADMFLLLEGKSTGPIKGESEDEAHIDEIEVLGWAWGMQGRGMARGGTAVRRTVKQLKIFKNIDAASTGMMRALDTHETLKTAKLSARKSSSYQFRDFHFMIIELIDAVLVSCDIHCGDQSGTTTGMYEVWELAFQTIKVTYEQQDSTGLGLGQMSVDIEMYAPQE